MLSVDSSSNTILFEHALQELILCAGTKLLSCLYTRPLLSSPCCSIEVTLQTDREDAASMAEPGGTSELLRVRSQRCHCCTDVLCRVLHCSMLLGRTLASLLVLSV